LVLTYCISNNLLFLICRVKRHYNHRFIVSSFLVVKQPYLQLYLNCAQTEGGSNQHAIIKTIAYVIAYISYCNAGGIYAYYTLNFYLGMQRYPYQLKLPNLKFSHNFQPTWSSALELSTHNDIRHKIHLESQIAESEKMLANFLKSPSVYFHHHLY